MEMVTKKKTPAKSTTKTGAIKEPEGGAFIASLKRNNRKIRADRATSISEDTELLYKRTIEDLEVSIRRMERDQENMLDLSPTSSISLVLASDFDSGQYVSKDMNLGVKIRNAKIKLEIASRRYSYLFEDAVA